MAPSNSKRKRGGDSDEEEASFGKQILPVANLPLDFEGEPVDGLQYLFTVRRDAQRLPGFTRVQNPFSAPEPALPQPSGSRQSGGHPAIPSEEWCIVLETRFQNLRANLNQPTSHIGPREEPGRRLMPDKKERDLWWAFLEGKRPGQGLRAWADEPEQEEPTQVIIYESSLLNDEGEVEEVLKPDPSELLPTPSGTPAPSDSPDSALDHEPVDSQPISIPREPSVRVLKCIDEPTALHLLMYFTHWINNHVQKSDQGVFPPRNSHARWIFALLSRVDTFVTADDMNLLRNLARACLALLRCLIERQLAPSTSKAAELPDAISKESCWIIISIIVHVWKQKDLWMDAESMLARFPVTPV
ncbi:hypothetical protein DFP72DRAFT_1148399 [Ephemerocybe angulata]|uniref:Gem-associated protein 2 n=1 Tax=Ephemerocybe angulata TaxID=980116 RepID=A0A8H6IAZ3_9AGAR|nr:hypothetical protein DFP72DRAFT_1148399 [Tulosesus angulatus]